MRAGRESSDPSSVRASERIEIGSFLSTIYQAIDDGCWIGC